MTSNIVTIAEVSEVIIADHPDPDIINVKLAAFIKSFGDYQRRTTNVRANMTPWLVESPQTKILKQWIWGLLKLEEEPMSEFAWSLYHLFGNVYHKGDFTIKHAHFPATFSFLYFVKCVPTTSPLVLTHSNYKVEPKAGRVAIFPSHIHHRVPVLVDDDDERITMSGNIVGGFLYDSLVCVTDTLTGHGVEWKKLNN